MLAVKIVNNTKRITDAVDEAAVDVLTRQAQLVQTTAQGSIITSDEPSPKGTPPHTSGRPGHNIRDAIQIAVDKIAGESLIGTVASEVGQVGEVHEHGKKYKKKDFDKREFMGPALDKTEDRLAAEWYGTV